MIENFKLHVFRVVADTLSFSKAAGHSRFIASSMRPIVQLKPLTERRLLWLWRKHSLPGSMYST
jgi:hypothetical protein